MDVVQTSLVFNNSSFDFTPFLNSTSNKVIKPCYVNNYGALFNGDCQEILPIIQDFSIDTVFADPPFNLNKKYGNKSKDNRSESEYLNWCYRWIDECIRILKPGGALFIYNLPKWNIMLGAYSINAGLTFRHDIAIDMNNGFPITGRLYPSHYSLLYFTKGKPKTFHKIRTPIEKCRHCNGEIKDYGGHRKSMNPNGVNLKDIWTDIPPVRHQKFKSQSRKANVLSTKLLDRIVELTTNPGDIILDPFGGSGTTYDVCEKKHRHWLGIEIDFVEEIVERLTNKNIQHHNNNDYVES